MLSILDPIFTYLTVTFGFWWAVLITGGIVVGIIAAIISMFKGFFDELDY